MRRSLFGMLALCGLVSSLSACAPRYEGFRCEVLNETPTQNLCTDQRIEIARGEAMVVRLSPQSDSRTEFEESVEVELRPTDPLLVDVRPGLSDDQTIIGLTVGETTMEVWVDGELESEVTTRILESEPSGPRD
ncbi:MAG: hypothetical protein AAF799_23635 [Myxococcota bacterium]